MNEIERMESKRIMVGEYTITRRPDDDYWMEHESGEGMQIHKTDFENHIEAYFIESYLKAGL